MVVEVGVEVVVVADIIAQVLVVECRVEVSGDGMLYNLPRAIDKEYPLEECDISPHLRLTRNRSGRTDLAVLIEF